ncbi:hypothetical protein ZWY2020_054732 [Hordeum vulgare]|nr:hypothetical protein ZWY2020_054732 [Hordeum vulgare]
MFWRVHGGAAAGGTRGQYGSETGESQQQGGGYHGVTVGRGGQQQDRCSVARGRGGSSRRRVLRRGAQQKPKVGRVRLTKVRLPTACRIEPQGVASSPPCQY